MKLGRLILDDTMYVYVCVQECLCTSISYTEKIYRLKLSVL